MLIIGQSEYIPITAIIVQKSLAPCNPVGIPLRGMKYYRNKQAGLEGGDSSGSAGG